MILPVSFFSFAAILYLGWPLMVYLALVRLDGGMGLSACVRITIAAVSGPLVFARVLDLAIRRAPGHEPQVYMWAMSAPVLLVLAALLVRRAGREFFIAALRDGFSGLRSGFRRLAGGDRLSLATFGAVLLCISPLMVIRGAAKTPLYANDALEYATLGRMMAKKQSLRFYPMSKADKTTGFYSAARHPTTYPLLLAWHFLAQGKTHSFGMAFLPSVWGWGCCGLVAACLLRRLAPLPRVLLLGLLVTTPALLYLTQTFHLDAYGAACIGLMVLALGCELAGPSRFTVVLCGLTFALPPAIHSSGVAWWLCAMAVFVVLSPRPWKSKALATLALVALSSLGSIGHYSRNVRQFGTPFSDTVEVWQEPSLKFEEFLRKERGIDSGLERWWNGVFKPWSAFNYYAWIPWLALPGLAVGVCAAVAGVARWRLPGGARPPPPEELAAALLVAFFLGGVALTMLAGSDLIIKNFRYFLGLLLPFAVLGVSLGRVVSSVTAPRPDGARSPAARFGPLLLAIVAAVWVIGGTGKLYHESRRTERHFLKTTGLPLPQGRVLGAMQKLPEGALVLSFKLADTGYYGRTRMVADIDPEMIGLYRTGGPAAAMEFLRGKAITHLFIPNYDWPTWKNSQILTLIEDPERTAIVAEESGWRLYRLQAAGG